MSLPLVLLLLSNNKCNYCYCGNLVSLRIRLIDGNVGIAGLRTFRYYTTSLLFIFWWELGWIGNFSFLHTLHRMLPQYRLIAAETEGGEECLLAKE